MIGYLNDVWRTCIGYLGSEGECKPCFSGEIPSAYFLKSECGGGESTSNSVFVCAAG